MITALTLLGDHVLAPIIAGCRVPRPGRPPATLTSIDAHYEKLAPHMVTLFDDIGITRPGLAVAA